MATKFEAAPRPAESRASSRWEAFRAWFRDLVSPEPASVRRERIEAEAAAALGLDHTEQRSG